MDAKQDEESLRSMARAKRRAARKRRNHKPVTYFYIDGRLHKTLWINKTLDLMEAWSYPERKKKTFVFTQVMKNKQSAYTTGQVAKMVHRHPVVMERYLLAGVIRDPQRAYTLDGTFRPLKRYWSRDNVLELHDYLMTRHKGRPRKDGKITPVHTTPSRAELLAMLNNELVKYYVKDPDTGDLVEVWKGDRW